MYHSDCPKQPSSSDTSIYPNEPNQIRAPKVKRVFSYNRELPIIFVSGIPSSGLELMRSLLDQNPLIRCTKDSEIITNLITRRYEWVESKVEKERLEHAGMTDKIIDDSVAAFILELILKQDKIADYLCNKDSGIFTKAKYVNKILPNSKFILMVRDPRGTVDSLIRKRDYFSAVNINNNFEDGLVGWNKVMSEYIDNCKYLGNQKCKIVFYEKLVLDTNKTLRDIEFFLNISNLNKKMFKNLTNLKQKPIIIHKKNLFKWFRQMTSSIWDRISDLVPINKHLNYNINERIPLFSIYDNLTFY
ncbi:unnamed protein product [Brachionus calyciflorus]|uniref:Protein-tyrosine sulfotransferase n=1 Tax=Brachionus calyciflorus TaxID=104777 RepID=A0A813UW51_9BILA|nr:unnamed protein product [Brachionus calyciflorus]